MSERNLLGTNCVEFSFSDNVV
jgi:hypothetical protein